MPKPPSKEVPRTEIFTGESVEKIEALLGEMQSFFSEPTISQQIIQPKDLHSISSTTIQRWKKDSTRLIEELPSDLNRFFNPTSEVTTLYWHFEPLISNYDGIEQTWWQYLSEFDFDQQDECEFYEHLEKFYDWNEEFVSQVQQLPVPHGNKTEQIFHDNLCREIEQIHSKLVRYKSKPMEASRLKTKIINHIGKRLIHFTQMLSNSYPRNRSNVGLLVWEKFNVLLQQIGLFVPLHWTPGMQQLEIVELINPHDTLSEPTDDAMLKGTVKDIWTPAYFSKPEWQPEHCLHTARIYYYNR